MTAYITLTYYYQFQKKETPSLLYKTLQEACAILEKKKIGIIINTIFYTKDKKKEMIINQFPLPGQFLTAWQPISIDIVLPEHNNLEYLKEKKINEIKKKLSEEGILFQPISSPFEGNKNTIATIGLPINNIYPIYTYSEKKHNVYVKNLSGSSCSTHKKNYTVICYDKNNTVIEKCPGHTITYHVPLPWSNIKKDGTIHCW